MSQSLDERTLQRCIDGELSETEHQSFLRELERHPSAWREVALAFMEHQLWAGASREYIRTPPLPIPLNSGSEPTRTSPYRWLHHSALVASALVAIGLGYLGGSRNGPSAKDVPSVGGAQLAVNQDDSSRIGGPPVRTTLASTPHSPPIAILPASPNWLPPRLSNAELQRLRDEGYQIYENPLFYTVPIENNRHLVVPVNTIHLQQPLQ